VAAPVRPLARSRRARLVAAVATALAALVLPASAQAHGTAVVNALDFEAHVSSVGRDPRVMRATVIDGDRKLELRVARSHTVVVLGYAHEPFLRFTAAGVAVNDTSPTAAADKLARGGSAPALTPRAPAHWSMLTVDDRFAWHDHRLGPVPGRRYGTGAVATWAIPVVIDGRQDRITGQLWHEQGPALWRWLVLFGLALVAALALPRLGRGRAERGAIVCAAIAGAAAELLSIGLSFGPGVAASTAWESVPTSVAVAFVSILLFVRVPQARQAVAGLVGLVAVFVGVGDAGVLVHGYVISSLPAAVIRAAAATAVCAGLIAAISVGVGHLADSSRPAARSGRSAMSVPRGKVRSR
jgi:hypothetical protein